MQSTLASSRSVARSEKLPLPQATWAPEVEADFWDRLRSTRDPKAREALILYYQPYARTVAASYYKRRTHDEVEFDDYFQLAQLGLIESLDRYDPAAGAQFKTFAARRMHGAILDGLEHLTERQQQIAADKRLRSDRMRSLESTHDAFSEGLEASGAAREPEDVFEHLAGVGIGLVIGYMLEGTGMFDGLAENAHHEAMPYQPMALRQAERRVADLVRNLPESERRVVRGHYLQHQPFDELAKAMGVTKGRVSQIHKKALSTLRERLGATRRCEVSF